MKYHLGRNEIFQTHPQNQFKLTVITAFHCETRSSYYSVESFHMETCKCFNYYLILLFPICYSNAYIYSGSRRDMRVFFL